MKSPCFGIAAGGRRSDSEKINVLRGIANSGYDGALDVVRPYLSARNAAVRGAAVESLRLMQHGSVDALIVEQLEQAQESGVRLAALNAMKVREPSDVLSTGLARFARQTPDPYARLKAVELAARWLQKRSELRGVVEELADRDERPRIRHAARAALGT